MVGGTLLLNDYIPRFFTFSKLRHLRPMPVQLTDVLSVGYDAQVVFNVQPANHLRCHRNNVVNAVLHPKVFRSQPRQVVYFLYEELVCPRWRCTHLCRLAARLVCRSPSLIFLMPRCLRFGNGLRTILSVVCCICGVITHMANAPPLFCGLDAVGVQFPVFGRAFSPRFR